MDSTAGSQHQSLPFPKHKNAECESLAGHLEQQHSGPQAAGHQTGHRCMAGNKSFAHGLLTRHGWSEGKGLGRDESGRAEALKVKLKFDKNGVSVVPGYMGCLPCICAPGWGAYAGAVFLVHGSEKTLVYFLDTVYFLCMLVFSSLLSAYSSAFY